MEETQAGFGGQDSHGAGMMWESAVTETRLSGRSPLSYKSS